MMPPGRRWGQHTHLGFECNYKYSRARSIAAYSVLYILYLMMAASVLTPSPPYPPRVPKWK